MMNFKSCSGISILLASAFLMLLACAKDDEVIPSPDPPVNPAKVIRIEWDHSSEKKISHDAYSAEYARIRRIGGDTLFLVYRSGPEGHTWDNIALRKSFDNGKTWDPFTLLARDDNPAYFGFSDPEMIVLKNGWIIVAFEGRGNPDTNDHDNIQIRISKDRGMTWESPVIVTKGRSWEPAMIQLPGGEIQLFYSSEARWWPSPEPRPQEILMIRSLNNGLAWDEPKQVAFTEGARDGMPSPLLLENNKGIIFAIENVGLPRSPWIIYSSPSSNWDYDDLPSTSNNRRWRAISGDIHGGGPYIVQIPSGETILSCHIAGGRNVSGWRKNTMAVYIGDNEAKNFRDRTYPWPNLPLNEGAIFNSLFVKDDSTVVALASRIFADGHGEIYWKEGHIKR